MPTTSSFSYVILCGLIRFVFFFNDPATTEIYTLSLHDALPILVDGLLCALMLPLVGGFDSPYYAVLYAVVVSAGMRLDRKSTRLNSSHPSISYAVFCLKKKKRKSNL